jgi:hypothetical protein
VGIELAKAYVVARGDTSKVASDLNAGKSEVANAARGLQGVVNGILATIGVGVSIGAIISQMREGIGLAEVQIDAEQRISAVVKGTGMAAGFTADELKKMASEFQEATTVGDESILELMARMLTFKSITGDTFKLATEVALDTAAVMGTDARQAALMLGRALEDPVRGVSALRRTGVSFSEQQKEYIKQLVESNKLNEAQVFILETVRGQMGEVATAMAQTDAGKLKQAKNTLGDIKEELGEELIPVQIKYIQLQQKMSTALTNVTKLVVSFSGPIRDMIGDIGKTTLVIGGLVVGVYALVKSLGALQAVMTVLAANPLTLAITGLIAVVATAAVEWMKYNKAVEESNRLAEEAVERTNQQIEKKRLQIEMLKELNGKEFENKEELEDAKQLVKSLDAYYGGLSIKLNEAGDGFVNVAEGIEEMEEANRRMEIGALNRQIKELTENLQKAQTETDKEGGRLERFGKAFKKTKDIWEVPLAFTEFFKGSEDVGVKVKEITAKIEEARNKLKELVEGKKEEAEEPEAEEEDVVDAEMKKAEAAKKREAGTKGLLSTITKVREEEAKLRAELAGIDPAIAKFESRAFVTQEHINSFKLAQSEVNKLKKELEDIEELKGLEQKWTEALKTPMDKMKEGMAELDRLREEGRISEEMFQKGKEKLEKEARGIGEPGGIGAGRFGFADFGRNLQDMLLKQDDPQKKIEDNTNRTAKAAEEWNTKSGEMIDRMPTAQQLEDMGGYA